MLNLGHKKLEVWKLSIDLIKFIYKTTESFPKSELFGITSQLRRASVSIASNIAEGCARKSLQERKRFFEISRSSLVEVDTQLEICKELNYMSEYTEISINKSLNLLFAKLSKFINNAK
ncbi:MAG: four helix bundle protein [Ignavibacteria bacterium]